MFVCCLLVDWLIGWWLMVGWLRLLVVGCWLVGLRLLVGLWGKGRDFWERFC
jgi:hypothetical protein